MKETPPFDCLNTRDFKASFGTPDVTLMSAHALHKEFALLRKACKPLPEDAHPKRPAFLDDHIHLGTWLNDLLPTSPGTVEHVRDALETLPASQKWLLLDALDTVQQHLRGCRNPAPLFLVPARWSVRMEQALNCWFYPAQIGIWGAHLPPLPESLRKTPRPLSHYPPSLHAASLLHAATRAASSSSHTLDMD